MHGNRCPSRVFWIPVLALASVGILFLAGGCGSPSEVQLTRVLTHQVCMVNDHFFGKQQIPVEVEDRTYYGCCDMCEKTLRANHGLRVSVDPVSGRLVDKATAVIGARKDGAVYYFESEENLRKFRPPHPVPGRG